METIHLIGSEGFIGKAVQYERGDLPLRCWSHRSTDPSNHFDLLESSTWHSLLNQKPTHVILLSWPGLPNYRQPFHVTRNLPACVNLIDHLYEVGLQKIVVAGTCYEYGLQNGSLKEDLPTDPLNSYAIAKDTLRRMISSRYAGEGLRWCWSRIFYPIGPGQNPNSFLPSLRRAIEKGDSTFAMSSGRQIRDFVPVNQVARHLLRLTTNPEAQGIYNSGTGNPQSLREIAEQCILNSPNPINLNFGAYPDREDEPLAFWANTEKYDSLSKKSK